MDGGLPVGYTFSQTGVYRTEEITIVLVRGRELARGQLVHVAHPKDGSPVVYQVSRVYPQKRVREYEAALLAEGRALPDLDDSKVYAEAYQWGWIDRDERLRPLRHPLPPNTPVFAAGGEVVVRFTRPSGEWRLLLGIDPGSDLEVELDAYHLIRQSCLICGAVGTGKTTTAISLVCRAARLNPPLRFLIVDKDGEYASLVDALGSEATLRVPWMRFFQPSDIAWEDYLAEFGWQRSWWNAKVLVKALKTLYAMGLPVTKEGLRRALHQVSAESLGFNKRPEEFEGYRQQALDAVGGSRLIPERDFTPLDPVELLRARRVVIVDLSQGRDTWAQKQVVVAQVLRRVFNEALEDRRFGCVVVLEEAMYYAPQRGVFEVGTKESRARLLGVVKEVATNGGRNGIGLWIVTQRLATVEKTVVTQCANNVICHALEDLDKERLGEIVGEEFVELIGDLSQGEAIVKGTALRCRFPVWTRVVPEVYPASAASTPMSRFLRMEEASANGARGAEPAVAGD